MAPAASPLTESQKDLNMFKSPPASISLPKHSYWYDFWLFVIFDIVFFLVMYFIVP